MTTATINQLREYADACLPVERREPTSREVLLLQLAFERLTALCENGNSVSDALTQLEKEPEWKAGHFLIDKKWIVGYLCGINGMLEISLTVNH